MKFSLLFVLSFVVNITIAQAPPLSVSIDSWSTICRVAGFQSGNGMLSATATGGVPDYNYQWTYLVNGETSTSTTWGGRNPGLYEIMITDEEGTILKDTFYLDSLNPIASFDVISDDLSVIPDGYIGFAPVTVGFVNTSENMTHILNPDPDTTFFFKPQGFEDWMIYGGNAIEPYTYMYGGTHTAQLAAMNKNGCIDTAAVTIGLFGPLDIVDNDQLGLFSIVNNSTSVTIQKHGFEEGLILNLYTLSGQQIQNRLITDSKTEISLSIASGIYIYEIIDPVSGRLRDSGKINF